MIPVKKVAPLFLIATCLTGECLMLKLCLYFTTLNVMIMLNFVTDQIDAANIKHFFFCQEQYLERILHTYYSFLFKKIFVFDSFCRVGNACLRIIFMLTVVFYLLVLFVSDLFEVLKKRCVMIGEISLCVVLLCCRAVFKKKHSLRLFGREFSCNMIQPLKQSFIDPPLKSF